MNQEISSEEFAEKYTCIKNIKSIDLTLAGMVELFKFDTEVLKLANIRISKLAGKQYDNPFTYFCKICWQISHERNAKTISTETLLILREKFNVKDTDPKLNSTDIRAGARSKGASGANSASGTNPERGARGGASTKTDDIQTKPYFALDKRKGPHPLIHFGRSWTIELQIEYLNGRWPNLDDSPVLNDTRLFVKNGTTFESWLRFATYMDSDKGRELRRRRPIQRDYNPHTFALIQEIRDGQHMQYAAQLHEYLSTHYHAFRDEENAYSCRDTIKNSIHGIPAVYIPFQFIQSVLLGEELPPTDNLVATPEEIFKDWRYLHYAMLDLTQAGLDKMLGLPQHFNPVALQLIHCLETNTMPIIFREEIKGIIEDTIDVQNPPEPVTRETTGILSGLAKKVSQQKPRKTICLIDIYNLCSVVYL